MPKRAAFEFAEQSVASGTRVRFDLPVVDLYTHTQVTMPVQVIHGRQNGPTLFVSAAIHGDEINGVEIIRRLMTSSALKSIRGTLILVPIVNVQGFLSLSRYTPDRRDLNRCFPGSERGSVAGRVAHLFVKEVVSRADYGIDLHTAAVHRDNLPQIRANLDDEATLAMAEAFGAPVILHSSLRDGSLREHAAQNDIKMLLYEAGEALRFDETCIRAGVRGVISVMRHLGMLAPRKTKIVEPVRANTSGWIRAEVSGLMRTSKVLGQRVEKDEVIAVISDPFGNNPMEVVARWKGILIGQTQLPLVNEGDALFHIARFDNSEEAKQAVEQFVSETDEYGVEIQRPII